jgi:hypothetical protein
MKFAIHFKRLSLFVVPVLLAGHLHAAGATLPPQQNTLNEAERQGGWKLLFDGRTTAGWHNFGKPSITTTNGWVVKDGWLTKVAKMRGGDILSQQKFTDFELRWEWRIPPRANNGLKYFIVEERGGIGHEYQMIDDSVIKTRKGMTASFYDVLPPKDHAPVRLAPEINESRVLVQGNHVEHWLNGEKVLEYECGSSEVLEAVAKSKFKTVKDFGTKVRGPILLTDHSDEASYRNIKIRELPTR